MLAGMPGHVRSLAGSLLGVVCLASCLGRVEPGAREDHGPPYHDVQTGCRVLQAARGPLRCRHFFTPCEEERRLAKQQIALDRLEQQGGHAASGRQAYLAHLWDGLKSSLPPGHRTSAAFRQEVMRRHSSMCTALSPSEKVYFQNEARVSGAATAAGA